MIHICVAKEVNKKLKMDEKQLFLGTIAPDISKHLGKTKYKSHFLNTLEEDIPNMDKFLEKYKDELSDPFIMGYYIHLFTDLLWQKYFISEIDIDCITDSNGNKKKIDHKTFKEYIYSDYTNLNVLLIDHYNLDLSLFYEPLVYPKINMDEIPIDELQVIVDQMGIIIQNSKVEKSYYFDLSNIIQFITMSQEIIKSEIDKLNFS